MKKSILSIMTIATLSPLSSLIIKNNISSTNKETTSIVEKIAQQYENNPEKNINYNSIATDIRNSILLDELKQNINIFDGSTLVNKYGYPDKSYNNKEYNYFTYNNIKYEIDMNKKTQFNNFVTEFKNKIIYQFSDIISQSLVISVISELLPTIIVLIIILQK